MQKEVKYAFQKINKDVAKSKHSNTFYWDAKNIRIITNSEFGDVTNEKGNEIIFTLPSIDTKPTTKPFPRNTFPVVDPFIIHTEKIDEKLILFTTNDDIDCIWLVEEVDGEIQSELLYIDDMGFTYDSIIESVGINESDVSQKVYWVDGVNEIRFLNIKQDNLNKKLSEISVTPEATLLDPSVNGYSDGGSHKSGVIQYAYNLYNQYGAETKVSGLSELVALQNDDQGNPLDAPIDKSPIVSIDSIPQNFEYIKVYSIYYSSLNQTPRIALIYENENNSTSLQFTDSNDIIKEISLNEFNILSNSTIIPKHITNKDGHLFFGDYTVKKFDVDYDARAFSYEREIVRNEFDVFQYYNFTNTFKHIDDKYDDIQVFGTTGSLNPPAGFLSVSQFYTDLGNKLDHDLINDSADAIYASDSLTTLGNIADSFVGAIGKNIRVEVKYKDNNLDTTDTSSLNTSLKRGETYRIGIVFSNDKDEESFVKWITDIKIPAAGQGDYENIVDGDNARLAYLNVEVNNLPEGVSSYRIVRVKRLEKDKTIKAQGFITNNIIHQYKDRSDSSIIKANKLTSNYLTRTITDIDPVFPNTGEIPNLNNVNETLRGSKYSKITSINESILEGRIPYNKEVAANDQFIYDSINGSLLDYSFKSSDILYKKLNFNSNDSARVIGIQEIETAYSKVDFFTNYTFRKLLGNGNKDVAVISVGDISSTQSFSETNNTDSLYLFQVDELDAGNAAENYLFFNIEGNETALTPYIIPATRPTFTYTGGETDVEINEWEYKKLIYNRKFRKTTKVLNNNFTFLNNGYIFNLEDISISFTLNNFYAYQTTATYSSDPLLNTPLLFENNVNIENPVANFVFKSNKQVIFSSDNLLELLNSYDNATYRTNSGLVLVEIYSDNNTQYGGNTYASRQRNTYIPFSKKVNSATSNVDTIYGDTYIQNQSYLTTNYTNAPDENLEGTLAEIISYVGESSVNNDMRYDNIGIKNNTEDVEFADAFLYNDVYQQENDLIKSVTKPFNFTEQETFRSEIVASPKKQLGELIDNWTKISINDRITMDTKYGAITGFSKLNDTLFAFQRNAIAYLAINPRIQLSTNDNIPIQLGSGQLIERYEYVTTKSGTLNSQSIVSTEAGIFYYDLLNYSINRLTNKNEEISLTKGLYNYIKDYSKENFTELNAKQLVTSYYNNDKEEILFTFRAGEKFTVAYNLLTDGFTSFYDFFPKCYFNINNKVLTSISQENKGDSIIFDSINRGTIKLWQHDIGEFNSFYGFYKASSLTLIVNEEPDNDKIMDNISYVSDTELDGEDQVNITFNRITVDTPYQTTGTKNLVIGQNIRRKFRIFRITLPREEGTRNRIRAPYAFVKLEFRHPEQNYKFVCKNITASYTLS